MTAFYHRHRRRAALTPPGWAVGLQEAEVEGAGRGRAEFVERSSQDWPTRDGAQGQARLSLQGMFPGGLLKSFACCALLGAPGLAVPCPSLGTRPGGAAPLSPRGVSAGGGQALTSPLQGRAFLYLVVVFAHRVHLGPLLLQDVLLAVPVVGGRPPQRGHRPELPHVAVEAHVLLLVVDPPGHAPHPLRSVEEVALELKLVHEILCGEIRVSQASARQPDAATARPGGETSAAASWAHPPETRRPSRVPGRARPRASRSSPGSSRRLLSEGFQNGPRVRRPVPEAGGFPVEEGGLMLRRLCT